MSESNPMDQRSGESDPKSESTEKKSTKVSKVSPPKVEEGTVRRALIRATLKPQEGAPPPPRQAPVFHLAPAAAAEWEWVQSWEHLQAAQ